MSDGMHVRDHVSPNRQEERVLVTFCSHLNLQCIFRVIANNFVREGHRAASDRTFQVKTMAFN